MVDYIILQKILETGAVKITEKLISNLFENNRLGTIIQKKDIITSIYPHLESSFDRCTKIKTILRDHRENFHEIYSSQRFMYKSKLVDQDQLCKAINDGDSLVIQGTGGGGKSMFIKYLWLYLFGNRQDKIPIFFELRNLNLSNSNIKDYIYHSVINNSNLFPQKDFDKLLADGKLILILDGFDEINYAIRDSIQRSIIELKERNIKLSIVVTSRPDERFTGWQQFNSAKVADLNLDECISVISRAPFDQAEKTKLIVIIRNKLFRSHQSFLSNPLLTYMTLVTYSYNPNFSDRMFEFYEMAFEALYYRHDLTKGGTYVREFYTKLNKSSFQKLLSFFCLRTYYDQGTEFSESILKQYVDKSKMHEVEEFRDVNTDLFIQDIIENVCILKKDGLEYSFTHRKFQEYFAAYCLARVSHRNSDKFLENFGKRHEDDVIGIVYDLNRNLFREEYIVPFFNKNRKFFKLKSQQSIFSMYVEKTNSRFVASLNIAKSLAKNRDISKFRSTDIYITYTAIGDFINFSDSMRSMYKSHYKDYLNSNIKIDVDNRFAFELFRFSEFKFARIELIFEKNTMVAYGFNNGEDKELIDAPEILADYRKTLMFSFLECKSKNVHGFVNQEVEIFSSANKGFDELL